MTVKELLRARVTALVMVSTPGDTPVEFVDRNVGTILSRFVELMRNRLVLGSFRYGVQRDINRKRYNNIGSAIQRLNLYLDTGNQEHLVDAANLCAVEMRYPDCHPDPHFESQDDGVHTAEI